MNARVSLDPYEALYECVTLDAATARAASVATLIEPRMVTYYDLAATLHELEAAHRQARQLGRVIGRSPLRPWLSRLLRTQRALVKQLRAAMKERTEHLALP
ncbi:MAG: hypothetical protein RMM58_06935 [Chloroflexota bacterium]|nr:hypothetical protein [Dehalococcoidia bacterium]MDW8253597.1 hypothetical protein [Chloroflexota bacterium]